MSPDADSQQLALAVFLGVALLFPLMPLALAWLWRRFYQPAKPGPLKGAAYECGVLPAGEAQVRFKPQYVLYCIVFLVFDVEAAFLVPFAAAFTALPVGASLAMLVFVLLVAEGLAWAWGRGLLNWTR